MKAATGYYGNNTILQKIKRPFCIGLAILFIGIYGIILTVLCGLVTLGVQIYKLFRRE